MTDTPTPSPPYKRRRKWIRPDLQLRMILRTMFVALIVLLVNFQLSLIGYWVLVQEGPSGVEIQRVPVMLLQYFCLSVGIAVPLCIAVSIFQSFRFCGPLYRFGVYLRDLVDGRWDRECRIRKTDDLHDVNDLLNAAVGAMTRHARRQHELISRARDLLDGSDVASTDGGRRLLAELEDEEKEFKTRFPDGEADEAEGSAAAEESGQSQEHEEEQEPATTSA